MHGYNVYAPVHVLSSIVFAYSNEHLEVSRTMRMHIANIGLIIDKYTAALNDVFDTIYIHESSPNCRLVP